MARRVEGGEARTARRGRRGEDGGARGPSRQGTPAPASLLLELAQLGARFFDRLWGSVSRSSKAPTFSSEPKPLNELMRFRFCRTIQYEEGINDEIKMNLLAEHGPQDLEQAWMYFKHWVKGRPISDTVQLVRPCGPAKSSFNLGPNP